MTSTPPGMRGTLRLTGYRGSAMDVVQIVGETLHYYQIRAITPTTVGARGRVLQPGETALVRKYTVIVHGAEGRAYAPP